MCQADIQLDDGIEAGYPTKLALSPLHLRGPGIRAAPITH